MGRFELFMGWHQVFNDTSSAEYRSLVRNITNAASSIRSSCYWLQAIVFKCTHCSSADDVPKFHKHRQDNWSYCWRVITRGYNGTDSARHCMNNSMCGNGYCSNNRCVCNQGYWGPRCQNSSHSTNSSCSITCYNGGSCLQSNGLSFCMCSNGYTGYQCQSRMSHNTTGQCMNNSMCGNGYCSNNRCVCNQGYWGKYCRNSSRTVYVMCDGCHNGGTCVFRNGSLSFCMCTREFSGLSCELRLNSTDLCQNMTCYNGGSCYRMGNSSSCMCPPSYTGYMCETWMPNINRTGMCPPRNSTMMGTCMEACTSDASCPGVEKCCSNGCGHTCQQPVYYHNPCQNMTCYNGGSCYRMGNSSSCMCPPSYTGYMCETWMPNINKTGMCPPRNSTMMGICVEACTSDANCTGVEKCCSNGCGHTCQQPVYYHNSTGYCTYNTECNNGYCANNRCMCHQGYYGYRCQHSSHSTNSSCSRPCYNGGSCMRSGDMIYCYCNDGYTGFQCESRMSSGNDTVKACVPLVEYSGLVDVVTNCLTFTMALNATNFNSSGVCRLYAASVACAREGISGRATITVHLWNFLPR
ncbi:sushi, nidogen and EGF-like domain-containing protein 1 [Haliotis rubra]|uniref:sushi, nidogen and EGF-like domain-containing protein 1 n=1 Tax=Haliotis rubra TaxID=36100 RepID=UPI001EE56054|nr:sushi, nidogen and EGF-like domain-containing protein 1 [Haliotis rubra]